MRVLGVDPGSRRVGLALADDATGLTRAWRILEPRDRAARIEDILAAAAEEGCDLIVIGLPTDDEGRETPACARSHRLSAELQAHGIHVSLQPEHLSTNEARRRARDRGLRRGAAVDHIAAEVILEDWLAARQRERGRC